MENGTLDAKGRVVALYSRVATPAGYAGVVTGVTDRGSVIVSGCGRVIEWPAHRVYRFEAPYRSDWKL